LLRSYWLKTNWLVVAFTALAPASGCGGGTAASLPAPAILVMNNSAVNFGDVAVGGAISEAVTFANTGGSPLSLTQNSVSGAGFATSGIGSGVSLAPGQYVSLVVSFNPATTGTANGSVTLTSSTAGAPIQIPLSGNGIVANHSVTFNWESNRSAAAGYNVYLRAASDQTWLRLNSAPIPNTSYTDWDVQPGGIYLFAVTSVSVANTESSLSNATSATIPSP
jgi:hypothetical protein